MKKLFLLLPAFTITILVQTQSAAQSLKKVLELKMPKKADDDMPGTRGASVTWHPIQKKYYAVFAGNIDYPLAVFDDKAKRISDDDLTAMIDSRGLWYDPVAKLITGNAYKDYGWFTYKLDSKGLPTDIEILTLEMAQPDDQSVGAYNPAGERVLFVSHSQVYMYDTDGELQDSLMIHWNRKKADGPADDEDAGESPEDYNSTTVVYTGIKGAELGFLNITNKQIELYDIKTGYLTKKLSLPETATPEATFNFSYANGMYWLFNMDLRKWVGYK